MTEEDFNKHPFILTLERIMFMNPKMTESERNALAEWESINLGPGGQGTSDWPGWKDVCTRLSH